MESISSQLRLCFLFCLWKLLGRQVGKEDISPKFWLLIVFLMLG